MNKGSGIGVGSSSIILVFAVLCLSVFSLITLVVAENSKALADSEYYLVTGYYETDAAAKRVLTEVLATGIPPETALGVDIDSEWDGLRDAYVVRYICPFPASERYQNVERFLHVEVALGIDSYEILRWQMRDESEWVADQGMNVWIPDEGEFGFWPDLDDFGDF
jgi:hypothetical protein